MSNTTIALRSSGATGNVPNALSLAYGEFALNYADGIIYYRTDSDTVGSILTTQPSGLDKEIQFNDLGSFGSSANLSFNKTTGLLSTSGIYVSANAQIVGNVTANKLISNNSIGDSGGELLLAMPAANTILDGLGITIDAFQNKIRFFEQGGTNRGAYIDLTEAAANVGTNLLTAGSGSGNNALQYRSSYTANSGQTVFAATYIPGYVDTFINGVKLTPDVDFTATNGTTITLSDGAVANDSVEIIGYVTVSTTLPDAIQHRYSYTANAAQTTFPAIYVAPYIDVYKNGGRLSFGDDFIANNGTDIVLTTGAAQDDLIEIVGYSSYTVTEVTADQLTTGRTIGMTGDVVWTSNSFNGTANVTGTSTLANTGVTAGTYTKVTVDAKGRVTTGNTLVSSDIPTLNQNTTGNAATATTANNVSGGTANVTTLTTSSTVTLNGGTANGVPYLNSSKVLTTGSALTFDGTNLGIGTSSPAGRLTVSGSDFIGSAISQVRSGVGQWHSIVNASGGLTTRQGDITSTNDRLVIDASGNVGIGTSTPQGTLHVTREGSVQPVPFGSEPQIIIGGSQGGGGAQGVMGSLWFASAELADQDFGKAAGIVGVAPTDFTTTSREGYLEFYTTPSGSVTPAERMRITSAGNVGIGTSSPGEALTIVRATTAAIRLTAGGTGSTEFVQTGGNGVARHVFAAGGQTAYVNSFDITQSVGGQANLENRADSPITFRTNSTERMRIDASGNVGIGTSSPSAPLTIKARASDSIGLRVLQSSAEAASIQFTNDPVTAGWATFVATSTYLQTASAGLQRFDTGGSERMRIDASGNVGIGTSSPGTYGKLEVTGSGYTATSVRSTDASGVIIALAANAADGARLNVLSNHPLQFFTNNFERARITAGGNVGIGVTNPGQKLQVAGNALIGSVASTDSILYVLPGSGTKGKTGFTFYGATFGASWGGGDTGTRTVFRSGASNTGADAWTTMVYDIDSNQVDAISWVNRFRINGNSGDVTLGNNGGNLLVGTSAAIGGFRQINITGDSTNRGQLVMARTTAATTGVAGTLVAYNGSNAICGFDFQSNSANNSGYIGSYTYSAGSFVQGPFLNTGGTSWTTASDENLKDIIEPITNGVEKLSDLRTVIGKYKTDPDGTRRVFMIAQDVQKVLPEAVGEDANGHLGLNYQDMVPVLVKAIQEQQVLINELKARLDAANL